MSSLKVDRDKNNGTRSTLNTTIDTNILNDFKEYCKNGGYRMNTVLESFMRQFSNDEFTLRIVGKNQDEDENE